MRLKNVIGLSFILIGLYSIFILANNTWMALLMGSTIPFYLIWMVYKTLKHPFKSPNTFQERFYEDYDYERNTYS